jgi:hypothetical protein
VLLFATKATKRGWGSEGFADLGPSFAGKGGPLFQDDNSRRGEFPPRQAKSGLVGDPDFAPRGFIQYSIAGIADIARHRTGSERQNLTADQYGRSRIRKSVIGKGKPLTTKATHSTR